MRSSFNRELDLDMAIPRNLLPNIFTGILVICAVIVTSLSVHQYLVGRNAAAAPPTHVEDWQRLLTNRPVNVGSTGAALKIIEFSDYQCPYCRQIEPNLQALVKRNQNKVAIVRYDLPLTQIHPYAFKAAIASRCAAAQGVYEPYETELFHVDLASADWVGLAREAKVPDVPRFSSCLDSKETASLVEADIKTADRIGISGTPTLVINGKVLPGAVSDQALDQLISEND